ncbi:NAD(P)-dependent oxidoreductase [Prauserella cavernicola]|uniref:NAD(P)-dependent oxidoreductase n=1 Tax=Prauserella cavernicola TaxID=2800127 RepID=A0A934QMY4_9PSEU|nr:NAD(P)-dependent oxidoreductase [Prauserella cavernicola]MBK1783561.1 NAD(P)-dependent oxidoreductase [Prauserella cavernicola]
MSDVIAFLGLGVMGTPMAHNIARAGLTVEVYDVLAEARDRAEAEGLTVTGDVRGLLARADVVVTMLPNTGHVEEVVHGQGGTIANARPGTVHIDMSSISPVATKELGAASLAAGLGYVDAPVSGGVKGAREGALSVMAGGSDEHLDRVAPVLDAMAATVTRMGPIGAGQATKVCNQVAVAINIQAVCEAFALGRSLGVDLGKLREALLGGATASWVLDNLGPQMIAGDDSAGFRIALQVKDLRLGLEAAGANNVPLPAASGVLDLYLEAMAHGEDSHGNQALSRVYERLTNQEIAERQERVT